MRLSFSQVVTRVGLQLVNAIVAVLQQVLLVPVFLSFWPDDLYRSWLIMVSLSATLIMVDLGLHPLTYIKLQEAIVGGGDEGAVRRSIGSAFRTYRLVLAVAVPIAMLCVVTLPIGAIFGLTGAPDPELRLALGLMILAGLLTVASSFLSALIRAANAINALALLGTAQMLLTAIFLGAGLAAGLGIASLAGAYLLIQGLVCAVGFAIAKYVVPSFSLGYDADVRPAVMLRSARAYVVPVSADLLLLHVPTLIMGILATPAVGVVLFTLTRVFASFVRQVASLATNPFGPEIGHLWTMGRADEARRTLLFCLSTIGCGTGVLIGYFLVFQGPIFSVWTSGDYAVDVVVSLFLLGAVVISFPAVAAFSALLHTGRPGPVTGVKLAQLGILVILCVAGGSMMGVQGISAAVFFAEALAVAVPLTLELHRAFQVSRIHLLVASIVPFLASLIISLGSAQLAAWLVVPSGLVPLVASSFTWLPIPAISVLLGLRYLQRVIRGTHP